MLTWLARWLEQIIAVVLLAGFIDLLLPNKAMQRYVRLVAGLLILLTILSPVVRMLQGDFTTKLDESLEGWFDTSSSVSDLKMPTLQDIERGAMSLRSSQQASAEALAERKLAEAMKEQVAARTGLAVESVAVKLDDSRKDSPKVASVTVTLAARDEGTDSPGAASGTPDGGPGTDGSSASDSAAGQQGSSAGGGDIEPVKPVTVTVTSEASGDDDSVPAFGNGEDDKPAGGAAAGAVKRVLSEGWAVDPGAVIVRQAQAADGGK
ncbi:stage III sporulation protein AF [Paenibacillus humicola]|uniref:stage III sporulation protein AF n=1 Tax=Paenibacillus humicola TaxID=3110540 RepID=UPI00237B6DE6|nr:stage III sporulation protein AF [Paenibacillus humicola]